MKSMLADLTAEYEALDSLVANLDEEQWNRATPFYNWTIKDEISHLAYFDHAAFLSATDTEAFNKDMEWILEGFVDYSQMYAKINAKGNAMASAALLDWWRKERKQLVAALSQLDPETRLPWYGPPLKTKNAIIGRIMEIWAHGRDIADALRVDPTPTDRLQHIAKLGVATFGWSFKNRSLPIPEQPVRVELDLPSGKTFVSGPETATDHIMGRALDFCLVVTQRRHHQDTSLNIVGETAAKWMDIAQAFAGPPENGPEPGERLIAK